MIQKSETTHKTYLCLKDCLNFIVCRNWRILIEYQELLLKDKTSQLVDVNVVWMDDLL